MNTSTADPQARPWQTRPRPLTLDPRLCRYSAALEQQLDLLRFYASSAGRDACWMEGDMEAFHQNEMQRAVCRALTAATPIFVSQQITRTLTAAMVEFPEVTFAREQVPSSYGFAYLDGDGLRLDAITPEGCIGTLRGILWGWNGMADAPFDDGTVIFGVGTQVQPDKPTIADGLWQILSVDLWNYGERLSVAELEPVSTWQKSHAQQTRRFVASLWAFMRQTVVRISKERPDRPLRRRLERDKVLPERLIDVVELRARHYTGQSEPDHPGVEWSCRWVVRGHWRNQACGENWSEHKPVWIEAYDKGPENLPLKNATKLFAVVR